MHAASNNRCRLPTNLDREILVLVFDFSQFMLIQQRCKAMNGFFVDIFFTHADAVFVPVRRICAMASSAMM